MEHVDIRDFNPLGLAYLGDTIWETEVRKHFVLQRLNVSNLNFKSKSYVNARVQSGYYKMLWEEVSEEEKAIMKRARNTKIRSFPKSCTVMEYREATAFEALIGAWYLEGKMEKIEDFAKRILEGK